MGEGAVGDTQRLRCLVFCEVMCLQQILSGFIYSLTTVTAFGCGINNQQVMIQQAWPSGLLRRISLRRQKCGLASPSKVLGPGNHYLLIYLSIISLEFKGSSSLCLVPNLDPSPAFPDLALPFILLILFFIMSLSLGSQLSG